MAGSSIYLTRHHVPPKSGGGAPSGIGCIVLLATADDTDGSFPEVLLSDITKASGAPTNLNIQGAFVAIQTNPGATSPDDGYDIALNDADGLDRLGGSGTNRDTSSSERTLVSGIPIVAADEALTVSITGNTVNSATTTIRLYYSTFAQPLLTVTAGVAAVADAAAFAQLQIIADAVHAEDSLHVGTDSLVGIHGVANEALADLVSTDGDNSPIATDKKGVVYFSMATGLAASTDSVAIGSVAGQGYTPAQFIDVDESEDEVKASAGTLHAIIATNNAASARFLKIYDGIASGVTVGSTTPKWTIQIPASSGFVWESTIGIACATGICIAATTGVAVADTGAPAANDVVVNVGYK